MVYREAGVPVVSVEKRLSWWRRLRLWWWEWTTVTGVELLPHGTIYERVLCEGQHHAMTLNDLRALAEYLATRDPDDPIVFSTEKGHLFFQPASRFTYRLWQLMKVFREHDNLCV